MTTRKAKMTDRQRVEAILQHKRPDRVPIWPFAYAGFAMVYTRTAIADAYNKPKVAYEAQKKTCMDFGWVFTPMIGYAAFGGWEFGGEIKWPSGEFAQAPTVLKYAAETPEEVMNLKVPDVKKAGIIPLSIEYYNISAKERLDNEPFNVMAMGVNSSFSLSGNIVGADKFCKWIFKKPEAVHRLLQLGNEFIQKLGVYSKDLYGIEGVLPIGGEAISSNQLISPKVFEEFAMPYLTKCNQFILDLGFKHLYVHICGEQNQNLPYWTKIPQGDPGIISIGHEIELETAGRYFPNDVIVGNLEPAIIQIGTSDRVYEATKKNIMDGMAKCPGGYIFSPGCELPPMSPVDNIKAMNQAVMDCGWY